MWSEITGNWKQLSERARQRVQSWTIEEWKLIRGKQDDLVSKMRQKYAGRQRYGGHFRVVMRDLNEADDLRVLDFNGERAFRLFHLSELTARPLVGQGISSMQ